MKGSGIASYVWAKWCLDIDSATGKDDGKAAEMTGDLEYCTDLGNRAAVGYKKSDWFCKKVYYV